MEKLKELWAKLPDSTQRALKTLWQAFFGTFVITMCMGLSGGLISIDAFQSLSISALSAAVAAAAAKGVNWFMHEAGETDDEVN